MEIYSKPIRIEITETQLKVNGKDHPSSNRTIHQMRDVLLDPNQVSNNVLYYMYRSVVTQNSLRYDITLILPIMLGEEYPKTFGHYHPKSPDGPEYPEVYQVLEGEAKFILQKKNSDQSMDVAILSASKGDCVIFPPAYGHVSINSSKTKTLILANIVSDNFQSDYSEYKKLRGSAIYYTTHGLIQNTNYIVRKIDHFKAAEFNKKYGFICDDLLADFLKNPRKFEFLNKPTMMFL